jgi:hypothetical protein
MCALLSKRVVLPAAVALLLSVSLQGGQLPERASLAGLTSVGQVVVAADRDQEALREVVVTRLETAGINIDPSAHTRLVVSVFPNHSTARDGLKYYSYYIALSFEEPVQAVRRPGKLFRTVTWSTRGHLNRVGVDVATQTILDVVEARTADFVMTVSTDTQAARANPGDR